MQRMKNELINNKDAQQHKPGTFLWPTEQPNQQTKSADRTEFYRNRKWVLWLILACANKEGKKWAQRLYSISFRLRVRTYVWPGSYVWVPYHLSDIQLSDSSIVELSDKWTSSTVRHIICPTISLSDVRRSVVRQFNFSTDSSIVYKMFLKKEFLTLYCNTQ